MKESGRVDKQRSRCRIAEMRSEDIETSKKGCPGLNLEKHGEQRNRSYTEKGVTQIQTRR